MDVLISLIIAAIFVVAYGRIADPTLQLGLNFQTLIFWFGVTFLGRLIVGLIHLPAEIHAEQEIRLLKWEGNPIDISLPIDAANERWRGGKVGIAIHNPTANTISNVRVRLKEGSCFWVKSPTEKFPRLERYAGSKGDFEIEHTLDTDRSILSRRTETVHLAEARGGQRIDWLLNTKIPMNMRDDLATVKDEENVSTATYELELMVDATVGERAIVTQNFRMRITFTIKSGLYDSRIVSGQEIKQAREPKVKLVGERIEE